MKKGSKAILAISWVFAVCSGVVPTYMDRTGCEIRRQAWATDHAEIADASRGKKTLDQLSISALEAIRNEAEHGAQLEPWCESIGDSAFRGAGIALYAFFVLFIGLHVCWLIVRAYNKLMDKLS